MYSPIKAYRLFWARLFSFTGRSTRSEFWWTFIPVQMPAFIIASYKDDILFWAYMMFHRSGTEEQIEKVTSNVLSIVVIFFFINILFITVRRLHDINMSGWWAIFVFVPFGIFLLWFLALFPSKHKHTKYGADPTANPDAFYLYYTCDPNRREIPFGGVAPIQNNSEQPAMATAPVSDSVVDLTKKP